MYITMKNLSKADYQKYENYLSPFGKTVLEKLIKHVNERYNRNKGQTSNPVRNQCDQNKRIMTFGDSYTTPPRIDENVTIESNDIDLHGDKSLKKQIEDVDLLIQTSNRMLKTADENIHNEMSKIVQFKCYQSSHCKKDRDADNNIESDNILNEIILSGFNFLGTDSGINVHKAMGITNLAVVDSKLENDITYCKETLKVSKNTDLIRKISPVCTNFDKIHSEKDIIKMLEDLPVQEDIEDNFTPNQTVPENHNDIVYCDNVEIGHRPEILENTEVKRPKRQNLNKITKVVPKKVKKIANDEPKTTFRKQKYTKMVKNWLSDVAVEEFKDVTGEKQYVRQVMEQKQTMNDTNNRLNKKCVKTIQAQLTNKDGIMKFGKPKKNREIVENQKDIDVPNNSVNVITKEKKVKTKFIPPIKSQIPLKNIIYTINSINDDNSTEFEKQLRIEDEDIDMILVFSNGFCQLNSQFTEETCFIGVMFQIKGDIFYWKGVYSTFRNTMKNIMQYNTIICYDGKNLLKYFTSQHEIDFNGIQINILDTQIGGSLLDPDNPPENFNNLQYLLSFVPEYTIATECVLQKCAWYLTLLGQCFGKLKVLLIDHELWKVFIEIEMKVLPIIADMERQGVHVDIQRLESMEKTLLTRMKLAEQACYEAAGRAFQINSTLQVRNIIYEELKLDTKCNVKIRETLCKGEKSTSESMLRSLVSVHPLPKLILEYRHLHKAHATFLAGIAQQVKDGIVKPTWVQTAAATGRISSNNPNLQAIPKSPFSLLPSSSNEKDITEDNQILNFRSVYIPREGFRMLAADFKHIECRVFAYSAADTSLLDALNSPDLFKVLAAKWLRKSVKDISSEDRERTKRIIYASLYGAGTRKLTEILNVSYDQALSVMSSFNRTFPSLKSFGRAVVERCARRGGRLATPSGRGRALPDIASADFALKSHAERQAINFIVQGSAADLCKMAMVITEERLRHAEPPLQSRLLLQIHDELVWEVAHPDVERAAAIIKSAMESVGNLCSMAMSLPVAMSTGQSWGEMEEFTSN